MEIKELKMKKVTTRDGHFMPVVFVDMSIPTVAIGAACTFAAKSLNVSLKDNKFLSPQFLSCCSLYTPICAEHADFSVLKQSLDDIKY